MKATKYSFLILLIGPFLFIQSCKEDESGPSNTFTFDEMNFTMTHGFVINGGTVSTDNDVETHNDNLIILSDGDLEVNEVGEGGVTFYLYLDLYSPISEPLTLAGGRYEFISVNDINAQIEDLSDTRFYTLSIFVLENESGQTEERQVTGGVVNIFNSDDGDLSVTFDLDFSLSRELVGGFDGPFVYIEED